MEQNHFDSNIAMCYRVYLPHPTPPPPPIRPERQITRLTVTVKCRILRILTKHETDMSGDFTGWILKHITDKLLKNLFTPLNHQYLGQVYQFTEIIGLLGTQ